MSRRAIVLCAAGAAIARPTLHARSTDFWHDRDPSRWSEREIDRLLTDSPWAKKTEAVLAYDQTSDSGWTTRGGLPGQGAGSGIPGLGGIRFPGSGTPDLGRGRGQTSAGRAPRIPCIVRWDSARPVLEAAGTALPSAFTGYYAISASGLPSDGSTVDEAAYDRLISRLKAGTFLRVGVRASVQPAIVQLVPGVTTRGFLFGFRKESLPLAATDKAIAFATVVNRVALNAVFQPREKIYRGELAV